MKKAGLLFVALVGMFMLAGAVDMSFAQDPTTPQVIAASPEAVTAADEDTSVTIDWGNWLIYWVKGLQAALITFLVGAAAWAARFLPGVAGVGARFLLSKYGESLVRNITDYAINAVEGAAKDKQLTVNVGSEVIATAVERAVALENQDRLLKWIVRLLGGTEGIAEKVFRRLNLEDAANEANVLTAGKAKAKTWVLPKGK